MSIILKYKEHLTISPEEAYWVYDLCSEMPTWDDKEKDYIFKKRPKRITTQKAKEIIEEEGLKCVCNNSFGRIYK